MLFCVQLLFFIIPCTVTFHFYTHYTHVINNLCPSVLLSFFFLTFSFSFLFNHISKNFPCCCCFAIWDDNFCFGFFLFIHIHQWPNSLASGNLSRTVCVRCEWWKWKERGRGAKGKSENACVMYNIWEHKLHNMKMTTGKNMK